MPNLRRVKKVMKKVLKEKENNIIKLHFDLSYRKSKAEGIDSKIKAKRKELDGIRADLEKYKLKHNKKKIIELEDKITNCERELQTLTDTEKELRYTEYTLKQAEEFVEEIKDCIKNPSKIYD